MKATYAKMGVSDKKKSFYDSSPGYVSLGSSGSITVYGFTYVIPEEGMPHHLQECIYDEWDKCHRILSQDKWCTHKKWHDSDCSHIDDMTKQCNCSWHNE